MYKPLKISTSFPIWESASVADKTTMKTKSQTGTCSLCGASYDHFGNNPLAGHWIAL
jgi:hypothetical protein